MALCIMSKWGGVVQVGWRSGRNIMALCIMSKCGGGWCRWGGEAGGTLWLYA